MMARWMLTCEVFWSICKVLQTILFAAILVIGADSISQADPPRVMLPCVVVMVHDGDSFYVNLQLPFIEGLEIRNRMVRVQGADAWEVDQSRAGTVGKISDEEIAKGIIARDAVKDLFSKAEFILLEPRRKGDIAEPHGRISAHVWIIQKDGSMIELADWLKANGHVRPTPPKAAE